MEYKVPNHQRGKGKEQQLCLVGPFAITRDQIQAHLVIINFIINQISTYQQIHISVILPRNIQTNNETKYHYFDEISYFVQNIWISFQSDPILAHCNYE